MAIVDNAKLQQMVIQNQNIPEEGSLALRLVLDFSVQQSYDLDLTQYVHQKKISIIQAMYVDASQTNVPVVVTVGTNGAANQIIQAKQQTQGYYPVLCPNPPRFNFTAATGVVTIYFLNAPVAGVVWSVV